MFEIRHKNGASVIVCTPLDELGFVNGFSTRLGGVSRLPENALNLGFFTGDERANVAENRRRFLDVLDAPDHSIRTVKQTHSNVAHNADIPPEPGAPTLEGDALFGQSPDKVVGVLTADCQPVLIVDEKTRTYAAIHAGWRGTLGRIVECTFERLRREFGIRPENCHAALGPSASVECYEVGEELVEEFRREFAYAEELFARPKDSRKNHLDVKTANLRQLTDAGIPSERIYVSEYCTMRRTDLFFSHRREQASGRVGRLLSVVGRR